MQAIGENTVLAQRYTLTRKLADRPDQEQWIATDSTLGREVTATVFAADSIHAEAALDSARRAAGVEDHHLPRVLDVGTEDGAAYVISEALHGAESIAAMLQFDPLPPEEVRRLVGESASGLGAAGARGLHHLQLTPHDIVTSPDGSVSVLGLPTDAALAGADDLSSEDASRADTVALVQIVYAGLTGRWPGEDAVPGLMRVARRADGELPAPSELVSGVPGDLDTLCRTTLGADEGPRTPGELARQLAPWSSERVTSAPRRATTSDGTAGVSLHAVPGSVRDRASEKPSPPAEPPDRNDDTERASKSSPSSRVTVPEDDDATAMLSRADLQRSQGSSAQLSHDPDDDYDPSFSELEPPVPGLGGHFEPDDRSSRLALLIVALLVVVAVVFAAIGLHGIGGSGSAKKSASQSSTASASSGKSSTARSSAPRPAAKPISIAGVSPWGLGGGQNGGLAKNVIDGDPSSSWNTFQYNSADYGGRGNRAGLLLSLDRKQPVSSITITTTGGPSTIEIYVSDYIQSVSSRQPQTTLTGSGTQTAKMPGVQAKYITIWVTQLSKQADGSFQERINDVKVYP